MIITFTSIFNGNGGRPHSAGLASTQSHSPHQILGRGPCGVGMEPTPLACRACVLWLLKPAPQILASIYQRNFRGPRSWFRFKGLECHACVRPHVQSLTPHGPSRQSWVQSCKPSAVTSAAPALRGQALITHTDYSFWYCWLSSSGSWEMFLRFPKYGLGEASHHQRKCRYKQLSLGSCKKKLKSNRLDPSS